MNIGDKVKVILLGVDGYTGLENVKFPTKIIDGIYYHERVVDVHGSVLRSLPNSEWPIECDEGLVSGGYGFLIGTEAIIVNSEE